MEHDKIMAGGNLDNIVCRLNSCLAMLRVVHSNLAAEDDSDTVDALYGACDMLRAIIQDFEADIAGADDVTGEMAELVKSFNRGGDETCPKRKRRLRASSSER